MSVRILFIGVVIFLVAFALPVSACDVESSKQNASVDTVSYTHLTLPTSDLV